MRNIMLVRAVDAGVDAEICAEKYVEHTARLATGLESAKITQMDQLMGRIDWLGKQDCRNHGVSAETSTRICRDSGRHHLPRSCLLLISFHNTNRGVWLKHHQHYHC